MRRMRLFYRKVWKIRIPSGRIVLALEYDRERGETAVRSDDLGACGEMQESRKRTRQEVVLRLVDLGCLIAKLVLLFVDRPW